MIQQKSYEFKRWSIVQTGHTNLFCIFLKYSFSNTPHYNSITDNNEMTIAYHRPYFELITDPAYLAALILGLRPANGWRRYKVTPSRIGGRKPRISHALSNRASLGVHFVFGENRLFYSSTVLILWYIFRVLYFYNSNDTGTGNG